MASIREYTRKKVQNKNESMSQRIMRHRLQIIYRTVLAVVLIAAVIVVVVIQIKNRVFESYEVISSVERKSISDAYTIAFDGNVLTYSRDGANCTDAKGTMIWNQTFEMQNPMLDMAGDKVAFGDYNGSKIYLMGKEGLVGEINTNMPIRDFCISQNGIVAAVLDGGSVTWIYLFNSQGEEIAYFKNSMKNSGYPAAVGISPNGKLVGVSHLMVENGGIMTSVAFYNFDKVGKNNIDNYASGYNYNDEIVMVLKFMDNETAFAVADDRIMFYRGGEKPVMQIENLLSEEIQGVYYNENYVGLSYYDTTGEAAYRLDVYNKEGKLEDSVKINMDYTDIKFHKNRVIAYNATELLIHNIDGNDIYNGQFQEGISTVVTTSSNTRFLLVTGDAIEMIELK